MIVTGPFLSWLDISSLISIYCLIIVANRNTSDNRLFMPETGTSNKTPSPRGALAFLFGATFIIAHLFLFVK